MDRQIRRPARPEGRSDRLDRTHPVLRDAQLRPARARKPASLSRSLRRRLAAAHRGRSAPRRGAELSAVKVTPSGSIPSMSADSATSVFVTAQDGLKLHVRSHGLRISTALPVVCLPGLARNTADFEALAGSLAGDPKAPRHVIALDSRGRGRSEYDHKAENYSLAVELGDLIAVLTALGIARAVFLGTSRGGILTMLLAAARPTAIAGCVLNDIGPVIEPKGLMRIRSYVGKLPQPASFGDAAGMLQGLFGSQFPRLGDDDWLAFAHRTLKQADGHLVPDYDPSLATILASVESRCRRCGRSSTRSRASQ